MHMFQFERRKTTREKRKMRYVYRFEFSCNLDPIFQSPFYLYGNANNIYDFLQERSRFTKLSLGLEATDEYAFRTVVMATRMQLCNILDEVAKLLILSSECP